MEFQGHLIGVRSKNGITQIILSIHLLKVVEMVWHQKEILMKNPVRCLMWIRRIMCPDCYMTCCKKRSLLRKKLGMKNSKALTDKDDAIEMLAKKVETLTKAMEVEAKNMRREGMLLGEKETMFYDTRVDSNGEPLEFCSGKGLLFGSSCLQKAKEFKPTMVIFSSPNLLINRFSSSILRFKAMEKFLAKLYRLRQIYYKDMEVLLLKWLKKHIHN